MPDNQQPSAGLSAGLPAELPVEPLGARGKAFLRMGVPPVEHRAGYELVTFNGKRWHWYFCGVGIAAARRQGIAPLKAVYDLVPRLSAAFSAAGVTADTIAAPGGFDALPAARRMALLRLMDWDGLIDTSAQVLLTGLLPFYPGITLDEILLEMDLASAQGLQRLIIGVFAQVAQTTQEPNGQAATADATADATGTDPPAKN